MNKWFERLIAPGIVALLVAGAANGAVWRWSPTAGTNATADPSINWSEGMSPSSVNDSARAMMARIANWRDDFSGLLATTGSTVAYLVTTNQGLSATPTNGQLISITPHATNTAAATLAADGGTAFPIQTAPGSGLAAGVMIAGTPYDLKFNNITSAWILKGFYGNPFLVPLGTVLDYTAATAPNANFALANGQCISRATYAAYFALVSTVYGACDGSTTFGIPDLSNRVVAGTQMGGASRITVAGGNFDGNILGNFGGGQAHILTVGQLPTITPVGSISAYTPTGTVTTATPTGSVSVSTPTGSVTTSLTNATGVVNTVAGGAAGNPNAGSIFFNADITASSTFTGNALTASFAGNAQALSFTGNAASLTFTGVSFGGGAPHPIMPPAMLLTKIVRIF